ncbi:MAG: acetylornithine deacetylase [Pseudomonadota bacterium]
MGKCSRLERTKAILADLLSFQTISGSSNLEMIAYLRDHLAALGADIRTYPDETGDKANLFATIGPDQPGGIVLSGHSDVVPVKGQDWTVEPFALTERDGRLYGRGAVDMKGFIAAALTTLSDFAASDLRRPLHLAVTYDEEITCFGAANLMKQLAEDDIRTGVAIIGEPTGMGIVEGHKGCFEYTTEFIGLEGHSSRPENGVSAIDYAVRFITRLHELRLELEVRAPADTRYTPPFTTVHVGRISGGTARNVIARHCQVDWEIRPVRVQDADFIKAAMADFVSTVLKPAMTAIHPEADIVTHICTEVASFETEPISEARDLVGDLTGNRTTSVVPFGTEAGFFQSAGISSIVCGPGSIDQAHMADEFIEERELKACLDILGKLPVL